MAAPCGFSIWTEKLYDGQDAVVLTSPEGWSILADEMILDALGNVRLYFPLHPQFFAVFAWLETCDLASLPAGRTDINGTQAYAVTSEYVPHGLSAAFIESHERYIDIQIVVSGIERIGICDREACEQEPYDVAQDCRKLTGSLDFITLRPGYFAILFPHDGHMPGLSVSDPPTKVRKVVVKVPVA